MTLYKDANGNVHDDMDGAALSLPAWPKDLIKITQQEADALRTPSLADAQSAKNNEINTTCAAEIVAGFDSSALGAPHHYTATLEDQANLLGLVAIGTGGDFTCVDGVGVKARRAHTAAQLKKVLADGGVFKDQRLAKARLLKDTVASAVDAAAVAAVVW